MSSRQPYGVTVESMRVVLGERSILDIAAVSIAGSTLTVIEGAAGSGKTTFAAALLGTIPASGTIRLDGAVVTGPPSRRVSRGLAGVVRDGARVSGCTVGEALVIAGRGRSRVAEALDRFELLAARRATAAQLLSGGEQQLLQIACAWCTEPRVLVLDSPMVGLAPDAAASVAELARDEVARGAVVIWLDQDERAAPAAAVRRLVRGSLSQSPDATGAASASAGPAEGSRRGPEDSTSP